MFYRFSIVLTAVVLISALPFQDFALASETEVCSVKTISDGLLSNSAAAGQIKRLSSLAVDGGNSSEIEINCSASAKLVISAVQIDGDKLDSSVVKAIATNQSRGASVKSGEGSLDLAVGTTKLLIDLVVDKGSPLQPGKYKFAVSLTFS